MGPQKQNNYDYLLGQFEQEYNEYKYYSIVSIRYQTLIIGINRGIFDMDYVLNLLDAQQNINTQELYEIFNPLQSKGKIKKGQAIKDSANGRQSIKTLDLTWNDQKVVNRLFEKTNKVRADREQICRNAPAKNKKQKQSHRKLNVFMGSQQIQPHKTSNNSLLFIEGFQRKGKDMEREYLVCQRADFSIFIGFFIKKNYYAEKVMSVTSKVTCILYIKKEESAFQMFNDVANDDKLIIGTENGVIYIIDDFSRIMEAQSHIIEKQEIIIDVKGEHITNLFTLNEERLTFYALTTSFVGRFDYIATNLKKQNKSQQEKTLSGFKYLQSQLISHSHQILFINSTKINFSTGFKCFTIIYTKSMNLPCILDSQQTRIWIPERLDKLSKAYNTFLTNFWAYIECQEQLIENILSVEHSQAENKIIVGSKGGLIFLYRVILLSEINNANRNQLSFPSIRNISPSFSIVLQKQLCIKEESEILSMGIMQGWGLMLCIASEQKVIFYDIEQRVKFSDTLKQKGKRKINKVKWVGQNLVLSCIENDESRVYLYSHELPLKKRQ